jgi:hypothetical protein
VASLQSGTSSRTSRRARATVSTTVRGERGPLGALAGRAEEPDVEADVVADDHRVADEVDQRAEHRLDAWCRATSTSDSPVSIADLRRDRPAGVHEGLERAEALAATDLDRPDLGDAVVVAVAARRLEIDDAERDVVQRCPQVVERSLMG